MKQRSHPTIRTKLLVNLLLVGLVPLGVVCGIQILCSGKERLPENLPVILSSGLSAIGVFLIARKMANDLAEPVEKGVAEILQLSRRMETQSKAINESLSRTAKKAKELAKRVPSGTAQVSRLQN